MAHPWHSLPSFGEALVLLSIFVVVFLLCLDFMKRRKPQTLYPPGPYSMPFIGNMLQVDFSNPIASSNKFRERYGDVYSLQFCWTNVVVLNGFEVMKEALTQKSESIADRPTFPIYDNQGNKEINDGVLTAKYGPCWKEQKRFSVSALKNCAYGKKSLEERLMEEASFLCLAFQSEEGQPFDPCFVLNNAVGNVICSLIFGDRFEYGDERFRRMLYLLEESMKRETGILYQIVNVIPVLVHLPGVLKLFFPTEKDFIKCVRNLTQEQKATWDPVVTRHAIDAFIDEIVKAKGNPKSSYNEDNLLVTVSDLFIAGTETTATTLYWGLLYMILHPDIQSRVHQEIDHVIGRNRLPAMKDKTSMPFTNAVIHETQRYGDILPVALPHKAYRDCKIHGFFIPKGTTVITNMSSVLKDEKVWEKPNQFYPQHFLDKNGNFVKREAFMAFSSGRRACVGEHLARMELFIFFTFLLQQFTFTIPEGQPKPEDHGVFAVTRRPLPYQICAELR